MTATGIEAHSRPDDIGMFHEILHWLHFLEHTDRYLCERAVSETHKLNETFTIGGITINLGSVYFGKVSSENLKDSEKYWRKKKTHCFKFEEMRTILGSCRALDFTYIEYDNLSENLYRLCIGEPLRYGHNTWNGLEEPPIEDASVTNKTKDICNNSFSCGRYTKNA